MRVDIVEDGAGFKASPFLQKNRSLDIPRATVVTGNNGTGKTSLLTSISAYFGLSERYSHIKVGEKKGYSGGETGRILKDSGVVSIDRSFDVVVKYQAPNNKLQVQSIDDIEDISNTFRARYSQGETALAKFNDMLNGLSSALEEGQSVLFLMDEPEVGISVERLVEVLVILGSLTDITVNRAYPPRFKNLLAEGKVPEKSDIYLFVVTQNPLIRKMMLANGSEELAFGGWERFKDPFGHLDKLAQKSLKLSELKRGDI